MVLLLRQKKTLRTKFRSKLLTCFVLNGGVSGPTFYDDMLRKVLLFSYMFLYKEKKLSVYEGKFCVICNISQ